jgi:hypothetical protein
MRSLTRKCFNSNAFIGRHLDATERQNLGIIIFSSKAPFICLRELIAAIVPINRLPSIQMPGKIVAFTLHQSPLSYIHFSDLKRIERLGME